MRRLFYILIGVFMMVACMDIENINPYSDNTYMLSLRLMLPQDYQGLNLDSVSLEIRDNANGAAYTCMSDSTGLVEIMLPNGVYSATLAALIEYERFNASLGGIIVDGQDCHATMNLLHSRTGDIVIKEIYCGGCLKQPAQGTYNLDSYIILHNNTDSTVYLDSLCFATLDPYNSNASSVWSADIDYAPLIQAVWQFPGNGRQHPLESGKDAVISVYGAIDHSSQYPLSVNLNKPDYYVCYNPGLFPNTNYHPAPGNNIQEDHILDLVLKMGQANAYTFSVNSPAAVIFRSVGCTMKEFVNVPENVIQKPGSKDRVVCLPNDWIIDGVEVFNGQQTNNKKRISASVDAGYITLSNVHDSKTLMRRVNESRSQVLGYEVLIDTNNSSTDFYERSSQSLHED